MPVRLAYGVKCHFQ